MIRRSQAKQIQLGGISLIYCQLNPSRIRRNKTLKHIATLPFFPGSISLPISSFPPHQQHRGMGNGGCQVNSSHIVPVTSSSSEGSRDTALHPMDSTGCREPQLHCLEHLLQLLLFCRALPHIHIPLSSCCAAVPPFSNLLSQRQHHHRWLWAWPWPAPDLFWQQRALASLDMGEPSGNFSQQIPLQPLCY